MTGGVVNIQKEDSVDHALETRVSSHEEAAEENEQRERDKEAAQSGLRLLRPTDARYLFPLHIRQKQRKAREESVDEGSQNPKHVLRHTGEPDAPCARTPSHQSERDEHA